MPGLFSRLIALILLLNLTFSASGQNVLPIENQSFDPVVHTVQFHLADDPISVPVLWLNGPDRLLLQFDMLEEDVRDLEYRVIHCDRHWIPTDRHPSEYIDGFISSTRVRYDFSYNTKIPYIHYSIRFPEDNFRPKISGNYALVVFSSSDPDLPLLTMRFVVAENRVSIRANIKRSDRASVRDSVHEIDFVVNTNNLQIADPFTELSARVLQNFRWERSIPALAPRFIQGNDLIFDYHRENQMEAGNEYRFFDTRNLFNRTQRVYRIHSDRDTTEVILLADVPRSNSTYTTYEDLNGKYVIDNEQGNNPQLDADYVWVVFTLHSPPYRRGRLFLNGDMALRPFSEQYAPEYFPEEQLFQQRVLLKQGLYFYQYVTVSDDGRQASAHFAEGSYYETENDYYILVYYKDFAGNFDRVIGYMRLTSRLP